MRSFKYHLNGFIYNLLYPGFLGSMIYDLVFKFSSEEGWNFKTETVLKVLITVLYCVDFIHLYGDMDRRIHIKKRGTVYFICDVMVALLFFVAFVHCSPKSYFFTCLCIGIIPVFILWYKWKLNIDVSFHLTLAILGLIAIGYLFFKNMFMLSKDSIYNYSAECYVILIALIALYLTYFFVLYKEPVCVREAWEREKGPCDK